MALAERTALIDRVIDGRYRVVRHLADGGMGSVYVAVDLRLDRDVALKVMREDLARDPDFVERFRKEARSAARLSHPHVVAVHDQGEDSGIVFLTMELVEGITLRTWLREAGALTPREALGTMGEVLSALAAAHRAGIVHRDIKPENVLISTDGVVKVADFGLARAMTGAGTTSSALSGRILGTVAYLAPEQVERGVADARSDVYAAGLMLHEMLTGRPAIEGDSPFHVAFQHVHGRLPAPSDHAPGLPAALDDLVRVATRRDPDERPADAAQWLSAVQECRAALTDAQLERRPDRSAAPAGPRDTGVLGRATAVFPAARGSAGVPAGASQGAPITAPQTTIHGAPRSAAAPPADRSGWGPRTPGARRLLWVLGALLLAALVAGWYAVAGPGSERPVPTVAGIEQTAAVGALEDAGLRADVAEAYSETVPVGDVISSTPPGGELAWHFSSVTLTVSRGPERYVVPDVTRQTPQEAARMITAAHLQVGATRTAYHESVEAGRVIGTTPKVGTQLRPDTAVSMTVSRGRQPIDVADWTDKPADDAAAALRDEGLKVTVAGEEFSDSVDEGAVISQTPGPGTLYRGDTVTFVVSKGPDVVTVPNVRGKGEREARQILEAAGFTVKVDTIAGGLFGTAHSTDPGGGKKAPRGSTITLRIV